MPAQLIILKALCVSVLLIPAWAQGGTQERAATLRAQLAEVQAQQTELQTRLGHIDEDIKPENIERSLAGVGSTHPEDLREARRRQLEIQRKGIQSQLDSLATTRARLESAIASGDAETYRRTIGPTTSSVPKSQTLISKHSHRQQHRVKKRRSRRPNT